MKYHVLGPTNSPKRIQLEWYMFHNIRKVKTKTKQTKKNILTV